MTKQELADTLERFGMTDLAKEVRDNDVSIDDSKHFTVYDKEVEAERGEGYGVRYNIANEVTDDGEPTIAVYSKLEEPEGGTVWEWADPEYYDLPEGEEFYPNDMEIPDDGLEVSDAVEADSEFDKAFYEDRPDDDEDWMEQQEDNNPE